MTVFRFIFLQGTRYAVVKFGIYLMKEDSFGISYCCAALSLGGTRNEPTSEVDSA